MTYTEVDQRAINTLRALAMDATQQANSGHPGLPMGAAAMAHVLWTRFLKFNPRDPHWPDRDRFVLSAGHGSMLLYGLLHLAGYEVSLDDLKRFRQWGSITPGHPEVGVTPGVEVSTGPLGQGAANAVGMAVAEAFLAATYNRDAAQPVDHWTYALVSDGDLMEGIAAEAASLAGHLGLGKLIFLYDDNLISLDGPTSLAFTEDVLKRFDAYGWQTLRVSDGNDCDAIEAALHEARADLDRPTLIAVRTVIGYGSPAYAGTSRAHGEPLGKDEVRATKTALGLDPDQAFAVSQAVYQLWADVARRNAKQYEAWQKHVTVYAAAHPELAANLRGAWDGTLPTGWDADLVAKVATGEMASRDASGKTLDLLRSRIPWLVGGSADLAGSNKTPKIGDGSFQRTNRTGTVLWFGVREHAMGAMLNGMAAHGGVRPYGGTFLTFSDYMRGAIRVAALSHHPVIYVFTHDSIGVGEDGPTHQPVEHVAALRAIPNLLVIRPADAAETAMAWQIALTQTHTPTALILSRQKLPLYDHSKAAAELTAKGGYVLREASTGTPAAIVIATGSEVAVAMAGADKLEAQGVPTRVVSMPCTELFDAQSAAYKASVLPAQVTVRVAVEAGVSLGWEKYVGMQGGLVTMNRFGASAPAAELYAQFGITPDAVVAAVLAQR
ncbi:MAG: transketolase [Roseiflexaceae bacterium]